MVVICQKAAASRSASRESEAEKLRSRVKYQIKRFHHGKKRRENVTTWCYIIRDLDKRYAKTQKLMRAFSRMLEINK